MTIEEVIDRSVIAVFRDRLLARDMVLKGGSAIRMLDHDRTRLSIDADFSIRGSIADPETYFARLRETLAVEFAKSNFDVFDFKTTQRPRRLKPDMPAWWRGWLCEFKLADHKHAARDIEARRRHALIPTGANSPVITIEISEREYCDLERTKKIEGVRIHGYTRESLILEKLRAICQQHPDYRFQSKKDRARDFYDIYRLSHDRITPVFLGRCRRHLPKIFGAKEVPPALLAALWDDEFLETQRTGFQQVRDSTTGTVREFAVYVEFLRYLVAKIHPAAVPSQPAPPGNR